MNVLRIRPRYIIVLGHLRAYDRIQRKVRIPTQFGKWHRCSLKPSEDTQKEKCITVTEGLLICPSPTSQPSCSAFLPTPHIPSCPHTQEWFHWLPPSLFIFSYLKTLALPPPPATASWKAGLPRWHGGEDKSNKHLACTFFLLSLLHKVAIIPSLQKRKLRHRTVKGTVTKNAEIMIQAESC